MPRDAQGVYSIPSGSTAVSGTTISSSSFNTLIDDIESDANAARPLAYGGTGSGTASGARENLELGGRWKLDATDAPTGDDDSANTGGNGTFGVGSVWMRPASNEMYICEIATPTEAVWRKVGTFGTSETPLAGTAGADNTAAMWSGGDLVALDATGGDAIPFTALDGSGNLAATVDTLQELAAAVDALDLSVPAGLGVPGLIVADEKAAGVDGGTITSSTWNTRDLNTVRRNIISGASLSSNQITLPAGTYYIRASIPGLQCNSFTTRLRNTTDSTDSLTGSPGRSASSNGVGDWSIISGIVTIAGTKVFEVQMNCSSTRNTFGGGIAADLGIVETYTIIEITEVP